MGDAELYRAIPGLTPPWIVVNVDPLPGAEKALARSAVPLRAARSCPERRSAEAGPVKAP